MDTEQGSMQGKTVLVTGATSGLGLETARALARAGARVVIGARDAARGQAVVDELTRAGHSAELLVVDMSLVASVREAAQRFLDTHPALDVLVNNAGVVVRKRQLTSEGHELTWATNFLGPFLLTQLLLPALRKAPKPRVINISSTAYTWGRIAWDDLTLAQNYRALRAYGQSKLALVLFTRELARREPQLMVTAVDPGGVATNIWRSVPRVLQWFFAKVLPSAEQAAKPVVRLVASPELESSSGRYFDRMNEAALNAAASSDEDAARLWTLAERATAPSPGAAQAAA